MQIQILSVTILTVPTAKGSYQKADVAYKNLSFQGKVEGKMVMSFGATAAAFKVLATAQAGEIYEVTIVKNDKGYNDWTAMQKANGAAAAPQQHQQAPASKSGSVANASPRSTYETPEERAAKQVYIVRQSSIASAVASLSVGSKNVKKEDVVDVAKFYEAYVFGKASADAGATGFDDIPDLDPSFDNPVVD